ncbi:MAG: iron ABC transporter permease [Phycisphaeraceae bacterium]|nr:MAG: iron ABC transporter permease [Phycisphaeraceae bacterium]
MKNVSAPAGGLERALVGVAIAAALLGAFVAGVWPVLLAFSDLLRDPGRAIGVLLEGLLWRRFGLSIGIAGATLAIALPLGLLQGWLLTRADLPLRRLMLAITPLPLFLPPLVHALSWFGMLRLSGLPAIVLVYVISFTPLITLAAAIALRQVGREHSETMRLIGGRRLVFLDDLRQALPAGLIGSAFALVFLLSDFAVADFLTSVGAKVTVYADALYTLHMVGRSGAVAGATLPGVALCLVALAIALRARRRLGAAVGARHQAAAPLSLGAWRAPAFLFALTIVFAGTVLPFGALAWKTGSFGVLHEQFVIARPRIGFTLLAGALAATIMTALSAPLAALTLRLRRPWLLDLLIALPLATPALFYGVGLIRAWNRPAFDAIYVGVGVVLIAMVGRYLPITLLLTSGAAERLDRGAFDAARLAGAGPLARLWRIAIPLTMTPVIGAWCVSFCFTLRELDTLIMLRAGQSSLTFHLYSNIVFARSDETAALALILSLTTAAPLILFLLLFRRSLRSL